jgi:hypothetical protein
MRRPKKKGRKPRSKGANASDRGVLGSSNDGVAFEILVEQVYVALAQAEGGGNVRRDVRLDGPEGARQFDVVVEQRSAGIDWRILVECKDHARRCSVTVIEAFAAKIADFPGSKGVIVSREGFTDGAKRKAKRLGIQLYRAGNIACLLETVELDLEVVLTRIEPKFSVEAAVSIPGGATVTLSPGALFTINDQFLGDLLHEELLSGRLKAPETTVAGIRWNPDIGEEEVWIRSPTGGRVNVTEFRIHLDLIVSFVPVPLRDVGDGVVFQSVADTAKLEYVHPGRIPMDLSGRRAYSSMEDVPRTHIAALGVVMPPKGNMLIGGMTVRSG